MKTTVVLLELVMARVCTDAKIQFLLFDQETGSVNLAVGTALGHLEF